LAQAMPGTYSGNRTTKVRTAVAVSVQLLIALVHVFRLGTYLRGRLYVLYYSYFSDLVIPFGMYFLLCLEDTWVRPLRDWRLKALLVFGVASLTEVLQAFGVPLLGNTFDPLDFAMFAGGVLLAVLADRVLLRRLLPGWSPGKGPGTQ
jgi:hypothetical protein